MKMTFEQAEKLLAELQANGLPDDAAALKHLIERLDEAVEVVDAASDATAARIKTEGNA